MKFFGCDTETELISRDPAAPPPRLATFQGEDRVFMHWEREEIIGYLRGAVEGGAVVFHNATFDFAVIARWLGGGHDWWWDAAAAGRVRCSMILDQLVRLQDGRGEKYGIGDEPLPRRSLAACVLEMFGEELDKGEAVRLGFGRFLEPDPEPIGERERRYAIQDAVWARRLYEGLLEKVEAEEEWGPLSEGIQVVGSIAIAEIGRRGVRVDSRALREAGERMAREKTEATEVRRKAGVVVPELRVRNPPEDATWIGGKWVRRWKLDLGRAREELVRVAGVVPARTESGLVSVKREDWERWMGEGLVRAFFDYRRNEKFISTFIEKYRERPRLHPRYNPLVRSGRTSASRPNLQQVPKRRGDLRGVFVPEEGLDFYEIDYRAIELAAVAQVLLDRYGWSRLADTLRGRADPHERVRRMCAAVGLKIDRLTAKMANFGFAGGMGVRTFCRHLKKMGVETDEGTARLIRGRWLEAYPEFRQYLRDDDPAPGGGWATETVEGDVWYPGPWERRRIWVEGERGELAEYLGASGEETWEQLTNRVARTRTGRVRRGVSYCCQRNTPFQGLAADGAKLALWRLLRRGVVPVLFVHDGIVLELPSWQEWVALELLAGMREVIPYIPLGVEVAGPMARWGGEAERWEVWDGGPS